MVEMTLLLAGHPGIKISLQDGIDPLITKDLISSLLGGEYKVVAIPPRGRDLIFHVPNSGKHNKVATDHACENICGNAIYMGRDALDRLRLQVF